MIANWILKREGEPGNREVNRIAAEILSNPSKTAEVISKTPTKFRQGVTDALRNFDEYSTKMERLAFIGGSARG